MRAFGRVRLPVVLGLALSFVAGTFLLVGPAWAKGGAKPVHCQSVAGPVPAPPPQIGQQWSFIGCTQPANLTGGMGAIPVLSLTSPPSQTTITWGEPSNHAATPLQTTFTLTVKAYTGHKDACGKALSEYRVTGTIVSNSKTPGVKGRIKWYVCQTANGSVSDLGGKRFPTPLKF